MMESNGIIYLFYVILLAALWGCKNDDEYGLHLFTLLDSTRTHVNFVNKVHDESSFNILNYLYFYDGGGVAIGDINNDGLEDIYFTSNLHRNRLYLNQGNFEFSDITRSAGVGGRNEGWSTGVSMADVNGDGWIDIYVCRVDYRDKKGRNQLFINNGDNTFSEKAAAYGLDHQGFGTQAAFFDYDKDGDLDAYLLNHSVHSDRNHRKSWRRKVEDSRAGDKLLRNDGNHFTDVTEKAGLYSSALGYGLGVAISDINRDEWPDIYIGNDFHEDDYLYISNGDGTFTEQLQNLTGHTSKSSMGNDIADFNSDGWPDIFSLDMLPEDRATYQRSLGPDPFKIAQIKKEYGYSPQLARNTLQLNRGKAENSNPLFSEIGPLAGVESTDWSWAGLFCDLDLDGHKDLYITNGIYRRPNDLDYIRFVSQKKIQNILKNGPSGKKKKIIRHMPSVKIANYAYKNNGDLSFQNKAKDWGLDQHGFSNGAAYGDLDNDGDPDLVVNNVNMQAFIYRNNADSLTNHHYLKVRLKGLGMNKRGIGAKVILKNGGKTWYREQTPVRGFQSSVSPVLNFGLGNINEIDSLRVIWPDDKTQLIKKIKSNQQIILRQSEATARKTDVSSATNPVFRNITLQYRIDYKHRENEFNGFNRQPLIPHLLSTQGPALAVGDINGDGLDDFYAGGARNQESKIYLQTQGKRFKKHASPVFQKDQPFEDVDAAFFDADGDDDLDLYVVSGGNEFPAGSSWYQDRLYINDGQGDYTRKLNRLPKSNSNSSCVVPGDFDADGDIDLFVGTRSVPGSYGRTPSSELLENNGNGQFKIVTNQKAPKLTKIGMVTDAKWTDIDADQDLDLVVVGDYMPVTIFRNNDGQFVKHTTKAGLGKTNGWWNCVAAADFDNDGDVDLVAGNLGENSMFKTSADQPLQLLLNDFNNDGRIDPILTTEKNGSRYPIARLNQLAKQMPGIQKKFNSYTDFSTQTLSDIFGEKRLENAAVKQIFTFKSSYFENNGNGKFSVYPLPEVAQFSPVYALLAGDFNNDGDKDIVVAGNFYAVKPSEGRSDAGYGSLLLGTGTGEFKAAMLNRSGFVVHGQARFLKRITFSSDQTGVLLAKNDDVLQLFWDILAP